MKTACFLALLVAVGITGCTDVPTPISPTEAATVGAEQPQMSRQDAAAPRGELIATPAGWYHRSCVRGVPDGARRHRDGTVTLKDGTSLQSPNCLYPGPRTADGLSTGQRPGRGNPVQEPDNNGWMEFARYDMTGGHAFGELTAEWVVPDPPRPYTGDTGPYFTFPALHSANTVLQPVLQYGDNGAFGGNYWVLTSWYCGPTCDWSTPVLSASAGDDLFGSVAASLCEDNVCWWTITSWNVTEETQTALYYEDTWNYDIAFGGVVEVYDISSCFDYPKYGVSYTDIALEDDEGDPVTPSWTETIQSNPNPSCNFDVTSTSSTVDLDHYASMSASLTGDDEVAPDEECGWQAWAGGGIPPYSYNWWGALYGSTQTIFGELSESSHLWVEITDATSAADTSHIYIEVDEEYECEWR